MVTASHNPPAYNGIKMWNRDGSAFDQGQMDSMERLIQQDVRSLCGWDHVGKYSLHQGAVEEHITQILDSVGETDLKVVVDCGCGATCGITPLLMRKMGSDVITLNAQPDGHFPGRPSEPTEDHLMELMTVVRESGADLGIAHDGDGDRMVAVDDRGRFVGGDALLALFASKVKGGMAAPINASMVLDEMTDEGVTRTRVGDVHVSAALKEGGLSFGGEPSGTYIFPDQTYCPDGVYAAALLATMVKESKLSELVDQIPSYPIARSSFSFEGSPRERIETNLKDRMGDIECNRLLTMDGYRAEFDDGWFLVRLSGTEPKIRITSEARDVDSLKRLDSVANDIVRRCLA